MPTIPGRTASARRPTEPPCPMPARITYTRTIVILDAGNCVQDRRNVFNLTAIARTPKFSAKPMNRGGLRLVAFGDLPLLVGSAGHHPLRARPGAGRIQHQRTSESGTWPYCGVRPWRGSMRHARALRFLAEPGGVRPAGARYTGKYRRIQRRGTALLSVRRGAGAGIPSPRARALCRSAPKRSTYSITPGLML